MHWRWSSLLTVVLGLTACAAAQPPSQTKVDVGRYQFAGKREYVDRTEIYYLDTTTGDVCYAVINNVGPRDAKLCVQ